MQTIEGLASEAKARVADGVAGIRPAIALAVAPAFVAPVVTPEPGAAPARRYTVTFDDVYEPPAAPVRSESQPAVSFDDFFSEEVDSDGIPVWEEPG